MAKNTSSKSTSATTSTVAKGGIPPVKPPAPVLEAPKAEKADVAAAPKTKLSPRDRAAVFVVRELKRIERLATSLAAWGEPAKEAADAMRESAEYARQSLNAIGKLPTDFAPAGRLVAGTKARDLEPGSKVEIAARYRADFVGALEAGDMDDLEVVRIAGKQAVVKTADGLRTMVSTAKLRPAGHNAKFTEASARMKARAAAKAEAAAE